MPTSQTVAIPQTGFLRLRDVLKLVPICRTAWYQGVKEGRYPQPVSLGPRTAAYRVEDIKRLIDELSAQNAER